LIAHLLPFRKVSTTVYNAFFLTVWAQLTVLDMETKAEDATALARRSPPWQNSMASCLWHDEPAQIELLSLEEFTWQRTVQWND
jgi:hypothetical protein